MELTQDQNLALNQIEKLTRGEKYLIKGYAGTGKTTIITKWIRDQQDKKKMPSICLTAPTNKAVGVLKEKAQELKLQVATKTIHSLLGLKMTWKNGVQVLVPSKEIYDLEFADYEYIVIDEASMINEELLNHINTAQNTANNKVIFMGDPAQLPPVGEAFSQSLTEENQVELTQVLRQGEGNPIVDLATYLREIIMDKPKYPNHIWDFVDNENIFYHPAAKYQEEILEQTSNLSNDSRILAWTNKVVNEWNQKVREKIYGYNPPEYSINEKIVTTKPVMDFKDVIFPTETLLTIEEEPKATEFEGYDCWALQVKKRRIYVLQEKELPAYKMKLKELIAEAKQDKTKWNKYYEHVETFSSVRPAHCMTVHKSQGSTFDMAFVCLNNIMANPRKKEALQCLYVAVTRPRTKLFLI